MGTVYTVDPSGTYKTVQSVVAFLNDGDTLYIQSATYKNQPQVYLAKDNLYISGINGRPRLEAGSTLTNKSNGKAIFVISGSNCVVQNIEFANAKVPDNNGAGIRQEGCDLKVTDCHFFGNEMGILGGNYSNCKVTIEHCVFVNNGSPRNPGFQHNVYINHIDTLIFQYNYTAEAAAQGHELKSRAHFNLIRYNYIGNDSSSDSRNIDLPNGGTTILVGNIIEQGEASVNSNMVGFGLEGLSNPGPHNLWIANNTFVNKKSKGSFVQVHNMTDTLFLKNNIMVGRKSGGLLIGSPGYLDSAHNIIDDNVNAAGFESAVLKNYQLKSSSRCINIGTSNLPIVGYNLLPQKEYAQTASFVNRGKFGQLDIGAYEFNGSASMSNPTDEGYSVYPNPICNGVLYYSSKTPSPFTLLSYDGKLVKTGQFIQGKSVFNNVPAGCYILVIGNMRQLLLVE
jgi:hypothetical protein